MSTRWTTAALTIALAAAVGSAWAQALFFNNAGTVLEPVIAVAADGTSLNVERATVTADRRYVTMDLNPQLLSLQGFRSFTFQRPGMGFVGSPNGAGAAAAQNPASPAARQLGRPFTSALPAPPSPLDRPGMTLVSPIP